MALALPATLDMPSPVVTGVKGPLPENFEKKIQEN